MDFRFWRKKENRSRDNAGIINPYCCGMALPFNGYMEKVSAMNISTAYRCVELISDSIAMMPVEVSKPSLRNLFSGNELMSRYTFIKLIIQSVILKGNGFA